MRPSQGCNIPDSSSVEVGHLEIGILGKEALNIYPIQGQVQKSQSQVPIQDLWDLGLGHYLLNYHYSTHHHIYTP